MNDRTISEGAASGTAGSLPDEFASERSRIESMLADPSREPGRNAEIRQLAEDLRERIPAARHAEFGSFFSGVDERLGNTGPSTGETGTPSAIDVAAGQNDIVGGLGGRQP
ncbi:hypothetical protein [Mangrovicella endophytica]|uniref:hypothetical protein n=1 Tax=Mangrovicella endophytica TaxID=2066697 RepID=UPI000C9DBEFC|nr:hypothetical protein [Mangrovicella endophytica]